MVKLTKYELRRNRDPLTEGELRLLRGDFTAAEIEDVPEEDEMVNWLQGLL